LSGPYAPAMASLSLFPFGCRALRCLEFDLGEALLFFLGRFSFRFRMYLFENAFDERFHNIDHDASRDTLL